MNEATSPGPPGTTVFDSMVGLALRRWCAPVLDLPPLASADDYLARRRELGAVEASRRLIQRAGISTFLVDTGVGSGGVCDLAGLASLSAGSCHEVLRLEQVAEETLALGAEPRDVPEALVGRLRAPATIAAKSIAAYRVGLQLPPSMPTVDAVVAALGEVRPDENGRYRLRHPIVHAWLAWQAVELGLPLQVHVGYGDRDLDLETSDPLKLTAFLRATEDRGTPIMLLHNYPFHRNAAYLAQVFEHVYMDVGLATHNSGALSEHLLRESLELVPFGKLLFSSDAYGLAELFLLGATTFRRGLSRVLERLIDEGEMTGADATRLGALVARDNAARVYGLPGSGQPGG